MGKLRVFLTPVEVAEELRLNLLTIYRYIRSGELPAMRFGRSYRIEDKDLNEFINKRKIKL